MRKGPCGTPAPVRLNAIGTAPEVRILPPATVNCAMVATLAAWMDERIQPMARKLLGAPITALRNVASYACRRRNGAATGRLSEHALANAIDIAGFETEAGRWIAIAAHWGPTLREREAALRAQAMREAAGEGRARPSTPKPAPMRERQAVTLPAAVPLPVPRPAA